MTKTHRWIYTVPGDDGKLVKKRCNGCDMIAYESNEFIVWKYPND